MTLEAAFLHQANACAELGSPFMGQLMRLCAENWSEALPMARKFAEFPGDIGPSGASLPLRLAGGLHALVLSGADPALKAVYPPQETDDATLWREVTRAMRDHTEFLDRWCDSPPQTNEVRRSAALIAAGHLLAAEHGLPFVLSELGASSGLNLMWDRYALEIGGESFGPAAPALTLRADWEGPLPPRAEIAIAERRGVDLNPLDAHDPGDGLRLLAYLWPDQPERLALTRAAIAAQAAEVDRADAVDWLETRLARPRPGVLHLVYHTVAWQYFPPEVQARGEAILQEAGQRATQDAPLARLSMEADDGPAPGARLALTTWPGGETRELARVDFHGRWLRWAGESG